MNSEIVSVKIPSGWERLNSRDGSNTSLTAPTSETHQGGGVTIYWNSRKCALGYGCSSLPNVPPVTGRAWRQKLCDNAVALLKDWQNKYGKIKS